MKLSRILGFLVGLLSGAVVGAAVIILITPQSGTETRQRLVDKYNEILEAGKQAIADRRQELQDEYETAIQIPIPAIDQES